MKNTLFDCCTGLKLPHEIQIRRMRQVIHGELTELQRYTLMAYYFQEQTLAQIAQDRGVNKSTVLRTLRRGEQKLRKFLKY